jgi:hypothetical protein
MKTGRLLKFHRAGADVHAYLYRDGGLYQAALYLVSAGARAAPVATLSGPEEGEVENAVRAWVEERFPPSR